MKMRRGLFSIERNEVSLKTAADLRAFFSNAKSSKEQLDDNIATMRVAARQAIREANLPLQDSGELCDGVTYPREGNGALGCEVLTHLRLLESARRNNRPDDAIHEAMMAVEKWMQLRANAFFEKPVREKERRAAMAFAVTNEECEKAIRKHRTMEDAAAALRISARQLRSRVPKETRDCIKREKKSP